MLERLKELSERYEELEQKIQDPAFIANKTEYAQALKELGSLSRKVGKYREYEAISAKIAEAEEIIAQDSDRELVLLAEEELEEHRTAEQTLLEDLKRMLVEDDTHAGKDIIVDDGIHPAQVSIGSALLTPGRHTLELVAYEQAGFARVELGYACGDTTKLADFSQLTTMPTFTPGSKGE